MSDVIQKIQELEELTGLSKHDRVVNGTINAIHDKLILRGDMLPSVNQMNQQLGYARMTIVKAYNELKDRGIVESTNRLGYFVANDAVEQTVKVALLLYAFHPFQEVFYNTFRAHLGENIQLEVFFHHNNIEIFETILMNIKGRYGMYVVAPIPHPKTVSILKPIPTNKLLIVDRNEPAFHGYSSVTQEFEIATYMALKELAPAIQKYERIVLFFLPKSDYPKEILRSFNKFIQDFGIKGSVEDQYVRNTVQKGTVYFTIGDSDLWNIIKDCKKQKLTIGKDVGIFSSNDSPVMEIIVDGITTFSTDFEEMARRAAQFVHERAPVNEVIPTVLHKRNSV